METNPYQPPATDSTRSPRLDISSIVCYWEKMRVLYNGVIGLTGVLSMLAFGILRSWSVTEVVVSALFYGITANMLYSLGSYANIVAITLLKTPLRPWKFLFYLGLAFSIVFTLFFCWAATVPPTFIV